MEQINEKKYLNFFQKLGYGVGDLGSNAFYGMVTTFVLIYLTNCLGLNAGIVGTLMMVSKLLDGITDVFFGKLVDNTQTKMGKARPWLLGSSFVLAALQVLMFATPIGMSEGAKYAYFFITYTAANALAYTANNISYSTLSALITKNSTERVTLGTFRFVFALVANVLISSVTMGMVESFGGGTDGWRMTAIIMSVVQLVCNVIVVFSAKEIQDEDENLEKKEAEEKLTLGRTLKILIKNKYYLLMLAIYLLQYTYSGVIGALGVYYCTYILGNAALLGVFSIAMFAMVIGLVFNPILVQKFGMYKVNLIGMALSAVFAIILIPVGYKGLFVPVVVLLALKFMVAGPLTGSVNAMIAEVAAYTRKKEGVSVEGSMFSCSSVGVKVGGGIGTALGGWLLAWSGFDGTAAVQPQSALSMINFGYFVIPAILLSLVTVCVWKFDLIKTNK